MFGKRALVLVAALVPLGFSAMAYGMRIAPVGSDAPPPPTVNLVMPTHGSILGGTKVAIVGTNLTGATAVDFGSTASTSFTVDSDNSITALSPPESAGTVDVTVTTPNGTSQTSSVDQFTYQANLPTVSAINPSKGPITGGTRVSIIGTEFGGTTAVDFGSTPSASFKETGGDIIVAQSPAESAGTVNITVTTSQGTSAASTADEFTYVANLPSVHLVVPDRGAVSGGTSVTVLGHNFVDVTAVDFGSASASYTTNSNHQITAVSPPGSGTVDITVTTTQGTSAISPADEFAYGFPSPTVSFILPDKGSALGGTRVTIVGTSLVGTTAVDFGSVAATRFEVNSDTSVTATAPPGTGTVDVTVTTPQGTSPTSSADQFTYVDHPPVVKLVIPNSGSAGGGTVVTIIGNNFRDASAVDFGSVAASFEVSSNQDITATSPAGSGTVDITVTTPQGTSTISSDDQFTYNS